MASKKMRDTIKGPSKKAKYCMGSKSSVFCNFGFGKGAFRRSLVLHCKKLRDTIRVLSKAAWNRSICAGPRGGGPYGALKRSKKCDPVKGNWPRFGRLSKVCFLNFLAVVRVPSKED